MQKRIFAQNVLVHPVTNPMSQRSVFSKWLDNPFICSLLPSFKKAFIIISNCKEFSTVGMLVPCSRGIHWAYWWESRANNMCNLKCFYDDLCVVFFYKGKKFSGHWPIQWYWIKIRVLHDSNACNQLDSLVRSFLSFFFFHSVYQAFIQEVSSPKPINQTLKWSI